MLGDDIALALPELRAHAESRMRTKWLIRAEPTTHYDPILKRDVTSYAIEFFTMGRVRVRSEFSQHEQQAGGTSVVEMSRELHIPIDSPRVPLSATAECVEVDLTGDPTMLGMILTVAGPAEGDQNTARRMKVTELSTDQQAR